MARARRFAAPRCCGATQRQRSCPRSGRRDALASDQVRRVVGLVGAARVNIDLWHAVLALSMLGLVVWLPGLALCRLLAPSQGRLAALACAPAAGSALLYCT